METEETVTIVRIKGNGAGAGSKTTIPARTYDAMVKAKNKDLADFKVIHDSRSTGVPHKEDESGSNENENTFDSFLEKVKEAAKAKGYKKKAIEALDIEFLTLCYNESESPEDALAKLELEK